MLQRWFKVDVFAGLLSLAVSHCHSLSPYVAHCHFLPLVVPLLVTRCHSLSLVVPLAVIHCHLLSLDVQLICLFINDITFQWIFILNSGKFFHWVSLKGFCEITCLSCLHALRTYVPYVPMHLTCLRAFMPQITKCLRAFVP